MKILNVIALLFLSAGVFAQEQGRTKTDSATTANPAPKQETKKEWYERVHFRGYTQLRYNRLLETNSDLQCEQCDKSWGGNGGFFLRRARLVFNGQLTNRLAFYIQSDFASAVDAGNNNFGQLRDAYFDLGIDEDNEFRLRFGQSKVPYGFENMQSSQNRLPLDRDDAINSALSNERDLGVFFYWAPKNVRARFASLANASLKGSGDYGVFAFGAFNGQTSNKQEANNQPHVVTRLSYPFELKNKQIIEPGIQAYTGKFILPTVSTGVTVQNKSEYLDQRVAASFILYPQPFGIMAEYNIGKGPEYNPVTKTIEESRLEGGYAMASYSLKLKDQLLIPFVRYQYYDGGKKHERDARSYKVNDVEVGAEWQPIKNMELNATYTISKRRFEDAVKPVNSQEGQLLRLQLQFNY